MHGDNLDKPLEQITKESDLLAALLHLKNMSAEANREEIENSKQNTLYSRGYAPTVKKQSITNSRSAPKKTLHKDIIKIKLDNLGALLGRAIPTIQVEALQPDMPAYLGTADNKILRAQYNSIVPAELLQMVIEGEWRERHEAAIQKKIVDVTLIEGVCFRGFSLKPDRYRGNKIYSELIQRDRILLDPATTKLETLEDCRWLILLNEMTAAEIEQRWGLKERSYYGGNDKNKYYSENSGAVRMFSEFDDQGNMKKGMEMKRYPVFCLFWQPGQPDILRFEDGDKGPRDLRGRMYIVVNDTKIAVNSFAQDLMGMYPVAAYSHDPIPYTFSGHSIVSSLKGAQDFVNILYNIVAQNAIGRGGFHFMAEPGAVKQKNFKLSGTGTMIPVGVGALREKKIQEVSPGDIGQAVLSFMHDEVAYGRELAGDPSGTLSGHVSSSVKSGKHAQTILESSNTLVARYISMMDLGHTQAATIEALMTQRNIDMRNPLYAKRYQTRDLQDIDAAVRELEFVVEVLSKSNLPATSISAELNWWAIQYNLGAINLYDYLKNTEQLDMHDPDWIAKVRESSQEAVPGIPPELAAQMKMQQEVAAEQQVQQLNAALPPGEQPAGSPIVGEG